MSNKKKAKHQEKVKIHPRNKHTGRYDFDELTKECPALKPFIALNKVGTESIDFFNPEAVKMLNKALLMTHYSIDFWDIPNNYLCPPIPGRADYIHHVADLLGSKNFGRLPKGEAIKCLDVGVGANCIYPIIGVSDYKWNFIGSDIDKISIKSAEAIVNLNGLLKGKVELRLQERSKDFFYGILQKDEIIDLTVCNPPFHSSAKEAEESATRKVNNLTHKKIENPILNFGGQSNELWVEGGEERFVKKMIKESKKFGKSCFWFTSLISKSANLKSAYATLEDVEAIEIKTIPMGQGNKSSRLIAWTFLTSEEQQTWAKSRWK